MMNILRLSLVTVLTMACGGGPGADGGPGMDGGSEEDGSVETDAGPVTCATGQHSCPTGCVGLMPNNPDNGCALGCGEPCEVADAICNPDGTCGMVGCEPETCDTLSVDCGIIENGCGGRFNCGGCDIGANEQCMEGACVVICAPDARESASGNDTTADATDLGTLTDEPDSTTTVSDATIHAATDEDWYTVSVDNSGIIGLGSPEVYVRLTGIPAGEDYDLGAWYVCSNGTVPSCMPGGGSADGSVGSGGCISEAVGADSIAFNSGCGDDFATVHVSVWPAGWNGSCANYQLEVEIN